jgi:hypothetical protein
MLTKVVNKKKKKKKLLLFISAKMALLIIIPIINNLLFFPEKRKILSITNFLIQLHQHCPCFMSTIARSSNIIYSGKRPNLYIICYLANLQYIHLHNFQSLESNHLSHCLHHFFIIYYFLSTHQLQL